MNTYYAALEATRTPEAVEIETINHYLTLYYCANPKLQDEVREYEAAQRKLEIMAGDDDLAATYLLLTLAKDTYRMVFGHGWEVRR